MMEEFEQKYEIWSVGVEGASDLLKEIKHTKENGPFHFHTGGNSHPWWSYDPRVHNPSCHISLWDWPARTAYEDFVIYLNRDLNIMYNNVRKRIGECFDFFIINEFRRSCRAIEAKMEAERQSKKLKTRKFLQRSKLSKIAKA